MRVSSRQVVLAVTLILAATSCIGVTGASEPERPSTSPDPSVTGAPTPSPSPASGVPTDTSSLPGRLLVRVSEDTLITILPDGTAGRTLTSSEDGTLRVGDVAWSPNGREVAWAEIHVDGAGLGVDRLSVATAAGRGPRIAEVGFSPFYLSWDPTSSRVGMLGNGEGTVRFAVADVTEGATSVADVADGRPFYFSWDPRGRRMFTNRNEGSLELLDLRGRARSIDERTGVYQAPIWSGDGSTVFYARGIEGITQQLVARSARTRRVRVLALADGALYFVSSPDGQRLAFHARGPGQTDFFDRDIAGARGLGVQVVDARTGEVEQVSEEPAMAWSWSPDGRLLAILEPVYDGDGPIGFRWRIVRPGEPGFVTPTFVPPLELLRDTVPFFTQFAQSTSMWSPDGSAIAYAVQSPEGSRIVVQGTQPGTAPVVVAEGFSALWSPV